MNRPVPDTGKVVMGRCGAATHYDVLIIGSGPGGSIAAMILASQGRRVLMVDRAEHPRFAIGESSTPIADALLEEIATRYALPQLRSLARWGTWQRELPGVRCGKKRGFSYFYHRSDIPQVRDLSADRLLVAASPSDEVADTHWYRADVDLYLVQAAAELGCEVLQRTEVTRLRRRGRWQIELQVVPNSPLTLDKRLVTADFIVDASGCGRVIASLLRLPTQTAQLATNTRSVFAHYQAVQPMETLLQSWGIDSGGYPFSPDDAAQHHLVNGGWLWCLRFQHGVTSVGWTAPQQHPSWCSHTGDTCVTLPRVLGSLVAQSPILAQMFQRAQPVLVDSVEDKSLPPQSGSGIIGRLQYFCEPLVGEGFAMLPTTASTLDPLHSTGLAHTISGALRVSEILLGPINQQRDRLRRYQRQVESEVRLLDRLISTAYASMHSMERFTAATMIYFAVAIRHEELRLTQPQLAQGEAFWGADQSDVLQIATSACQYLQRVPRDSAWLSTEALASAIQPLLRQLTKVPLLTAAAGGLYGYTFAEDGIGY